MSSPIIKLSVSIKIALLPIITIITYYYIFETEQLADEPAQGWGPRPKQPAPLQRLRGSRGTAPTVGIDQAVLRGQVPGGARQIEGAGPGRKRLVLAGQRAALLIQKLPDECLGQPALPPRVLSACRGEVDLNLHFLERLLDCAKHLDGPTKQELCQHVAGLASGLQEGERKPSK